MNKIIALCLMASIGFTACNNNSAKEEALAKAAALKQVKDSLALDSFRRAEIAEKEQLEQEKLQAQEMETQAARNTSYSEPEQGSQYYEASESNTAPVAASTQKKGWSDAAKGTAIGAGAGAVMGALIDKDKRLRGAAIGAAIGGAGGYAIGRKKDRQSGRVQ
ncbi:MULTISPECIES: YMGG-like glycine zipper-containing protein [Olivibacter]|uniref:17 kDa surface antigen n=3 Tax=Sphingobacteriaceae TaxID=84566 RepID=F4C3H4_SPHS2|nr:MULTISPECIES: YMGG-like glycine zipper-containing protein [Olivibacter]MCL4640278.1 YMGG-like glycine zipper-containing protein [Olivibacter sp. UJ_SKK_5.1]MDM8174605.1 YMGG-like glycine zipper-containing protein [Olivibacter sp. 47]MDX3913638.1 YMGG-like glycine zipper-containing protein [Pseudosphingobacterium sp.]QEL01410.1 glycine zipper 2TM domain-containing protein [Olivibacter sp. LS-1]